MSTGGGGRAKGGCRVGYFSSVICLGSICRHNSTDGAAAVQPFLLPLFFFLFSFYFLLLCKREPFSPSSAKAHSPRSTHIYSMIGESRSSRRSARFLHSLKTSENPGALVSSSYGTKARMAIRSY